MSRSYPPKTGAIHSSVIKAKGTVLGFTAGFGCLLRGLKFVYVDHRELARFYVPPMLFSLLFIIGGWIFFGKTVDQVVAWFWAEPKPDDWWGLASVLWGVVAFLLWVTFAFVTLITAVFLFSLFAAPFSDLISERTEGILNTWDPRPFSWIFLFKDLWQTVLLEFVRMLVKIAWLLPLLILSWVIPVVGQLVYFVLGGYLLAKFIGMDYVDWCMARRGWTWKQRFAFAKKHRWALAGLGTAVLLALMIPLAFVVIWPAAVAGGAILFSSLHQTER